MIFDQSTKKNKQIIICDVVLHDVFRKYLLAKSCRQQKKNDSNIKIEEVQVSKYYYQ